MSKSFIVIEELTSGKGFVEIISLPVTEEETLNEEEIEKGVKELRDLFYKCEKVELSSKNVALSIRGCDKKTFRVTYVEGGE